MENITFRKLQDKEYEIELIELFNKVFGRNATKTTWENKHIKNPISSSGIFGAFDGEKLVGMNAFMPMEYQYGTKTLKVVQSCESAVDPNYRRRGIWIGIIRLAEEYYINEGYDCFIGFPNPENSYSGFLKNGWENTSNLVKMIKILNPIGIVKHLLGVQFELKTYNTSDSFKEISIKEFCDISRNVQTDFIRPRWSPEFIGWKLLNEGYNILGYYRNERLEGAIYFRLVKKKKLKVLEIDGIESFHQECSIANICNEFVRLQRRKNDICFIFTNENAQIDFKKFGFKQYKSDTVIPFIVKKIKSTENRFVWNPMMVESDGTLRID